MRPVVYFGRASGTSRSPTVVRLISRFIYFNKKRGIIFFLVEVLVESTLRPADCSARSDLGPLLLQMQLLIAVKETPRLLRLFVSLHIAPLSCVFLFIFLTFRFIVGEVNGFKLCLKTDFTSAATLTAPDWEETMIFMPLPRLCSGSKIESRAKEARAAVETGSAVWSRLKCSPPVFFFFFVQPCRLPRLSP